ncbi:MAG: hypothetical protein R6X19_09440, partial [Kiritimatiellia bacterium]
RLQSPATGDVVGHCLSPADLAVSKLAAGRDKDIAFVSILIARRFVPVPAIENLAATLPPAARETVRQSLKLAMARRS